MSHNMSYDFEAGRHLIASVKGCKPGPTLIVLGSVHGNEPAGALAARRVFAQLEAKMAGAAKPKIKPAQAEAIF